MTRECFLELFKVFNTKYGFKFKTRHLIELKIASLCTFNKPAVLKTNIKRNEKKIKVHFFQKSQNKV